MSVKYAELKQDGRQVKQTFAGTWTTYIITSGETTERFTVPNIKTSGQVVYCVYCTEPVESPLQILNTNNVGLPRCGDVYVEPYKDGNNVWQTRVFPRVYFKAATPRFIGSRGALWLWEVVYDVDGTTTETPSADEGDEETETSETTTLTFSTSMSVEEYASAVDIRGYPNCSTLGEFFADPIMLKYGVLSMTYQRKEYSNPLSTLMNYYKCVNSSTLWGFPAGTVLLDDASFTTTQLVDENGDASSEYDVTYKLSYKRGYEGAGWNVVKANAGLYCNSGGSIVRALNDDGSPSDQPVLLSSAGVRLDSISPTAAVSPLMLDFQVYPSADLSALGLPSPFGV